MNNIDYNQIALVELRNVAREKGIVRSTTMKKKELVEKLNDIDSGKEKPQYSTRGRPPMINPANYLSMNPPKRIDKQSLKELIDKFERELFCFLFDD